MKLFVFWIFVLVSIAACDVDFSDLKCTKTPVDLVFVIDSSSSIFPNEFVRQLEFLENITGALDVGPSPGQSRVGVVSFSDEPRLEFTLGQYIEKAAVVSAIRRINYLSGGTNTAAAIGLAADSMFLKDNGARPNAKDVIIVITDGESFSESETKASALKAREGGIVMLAIGVGVSVNVNELRLITGVPEYVYQVSKYEDLRNITEALINKTCIEIQATTSNPLPQNDLLQNESTIFERCGGKPADILFLIDSSSSIHRNDFKKEVKFVKTIVSAFDIGPEKASVGVSTFSDSFQSVIQLNEFTTKENILKALDYVPYLRGGTDTGNALKNIREYGFNMARPNVAHILIVITDGLSRDPADTLLQAKLLKESGVQIFAIGVGPFTDKKELRNMASSSEEDLKYNFNVFTFDALKSVEKLLVKNTCEVSKQQMEDIPRCDLQNPFDILFVFDSASVGNQASEIILNTTQRLKELQFPDTVDVHVGVISQSCVFDGDIPFQSLRDNFTVGPSSDKFASLVRRSRTFGLSAENGAGSNADQIVVLLVDSLLTKAAEKEILELENVADKLYIVYLSKWQNTETSLTVSSSTFLLKNIADTGLPDFLQKELCGIDMPK